MWGVGVCLLVCLGSGRWVSLVGLACEEDGLGAKD